MKRKRQERFSKVTPPLKIVRVGLMETMEKVRKTFPQFPQAGCAARRGVAHAPFGDLVGHSAHGLEREREDFCFLG